MFLAMNSEVSNRRRSPLIYLVFVLGCLVIVLLALNVYFSVLLGVGRASNAPDNTNKSVPAKEEVIKRKVCNTKECVEISANILGKMNFSANPCEDMFEYSCGQHNVKETTKMESHFASEAMDRFKEDMSKILSSADASLYGKDSTALAKMKKYHRLCMDEESLSSHLKPKILQLISDVGSWTLTKDGVKPFDSSTWSLQKTLLKLHKLALWPFLKLKSTRDGEKKER